MFDARHRFVLSYQWNLPWFSKPENWYGHILGNWQVNGVTTFQTNIPFTVYDSSNPSAQGGAPEISGFFSARPNLAGDPNSGSCQENGVSVPIRTANCWFNTSAFINPPNFTYGNLGRTVPDLRTPGTANFDCSLIKNTRLRERVRTVFQVP